MIKKLVSASFCLMLTLPIQASAKPGIVSNNPADMPAGTWRLDQQHSSVIVKFNHMGFSMMTFHFHKFGGSFSYDPAHPMASDIKVEVDPASVDTGIPALDQELATKKWFDAEHGNGINFVATEIKSADGHRGTVTGNLTIRGITKPVILDVVFNGYGYKIEPNTQVAGFSATAIVDRSEYGMTEWAGVLPDKVTIVIEAEFKKIPATSTVPAA